MDNSVKFFSESRAFSEVMETEHIEKALFSSSLNRQDALNRKSTYQEVFSNYESLKDYAQKNFSSFADFPILSNQYFNASILSYVTSFAGFLSIERPMDAAEALLHWMDVVGVASGNTVLPNLGPENLTNMKSRITWPTTLVAATFTYNIALGKKLIPGSINIKITLAGGTIVTITDDRQGNLLAKPGVLDGCTIDYNAGSIQLILGSTFTFAGGEPLVLVAVEDVAGNPDMNNYTNPVTGAANYYKNRYKAKLRNITLKTEPDMIVSESDLATTAAMQKAVKINPQDFMASKLVEIFTKVLNQTLIERIQSGYAGTTHQIDMTGKSAIYGDFRSILDFFSSQTTDVNKALVKKSIKGTRATAYVVGEDVADWFTKLATIGLFTENTTSTYINDLVGYYKGTIPVLKHTDIAAADGYAIHKTSDGNMAPLMRGIFLPLTPFPQVGNYNNPTQLAGGLYYQEGVEQIASELVQKFTLV